MFFPDFLRRAFPERETRVSNGGEADDHVDFRFFLRMVFKRMFNIALETDEIALVQIGGVFPRRDADVARQDRDELLGAFRVRLRTVNASGFQRHKIKLQLFRHADRGEHLEHRSRLIRCKRRDRIRTVYLKSLDLSAFAFQKQLEIDSERMRDLPHRCDRRIHLAGFDLREHRLGHPARSRKRIQ